MITYPELGLPEAWKPVFQAMDGHGWELLHAHGGCMDWGCRQRLEFGRGWERCFLVWLNEPDMCGNNLQQWGLTVVGICPDLPRDWDAAEAHILMLTGGWEDELDEFLQGFFDEKSRLGAPSALRDSALET